MMLVLLGFSPFTIEDGSRPVDPRHRRQRPDRLPPGRDLLRQGPHPARLRRLLRLPDRALRRLPARQAGLGLGAAPLRRAAAEEAGQGRRALPRRTAAPSASRTPSATSSAASRARGWRRRKRRPSPRPARPAKKCASEPNASPTPATAKTTDSRLRCRCRRGSRSLRPSAGGRLRWRCGFRGLRGRRFRLRLRRRRGHRGPIA